jgi:outer membrane protein assembly factor BamB
MFHHDAQHTGCSPFDTSANKGGIKWRCEVTPDSSIFSSPAIDSDGNVYAGSADGYFHAINPNGTLKWSYLTGAAVESSPAIASDGTIIFGSDDGYLYALYQNGTLRWKYNVGMAVVTPVIALNDTIYVGSIDNFLYSFFLNGTLNWRYQTGDYVISFPALDTAGAIYFGSDDSYIYALNPNGTLRWRYQTGGPIDVSSPSIGSDGTIYVGSHDTYLYALYPNGTLKWRLSVGGQRVFSSPAVYQDGTVYVGGGDGYFYAVNPNGTLKWRYLTGGAYIISSPAVGYDGGIYFGSPDHMIYALNPNGTLRWKRATGDEIVSSPAIDPNGTVYIASYDHYIYAINGDENAVPSRPQELTATGYDVGVHLLWGAPATDGGSPVASYNIYRGNSTSNATYFNSIPNPGSHVVTWEDFLVVKGENYYYYVTALNVVGESERSNFASATPRGVPYYPRNLDARSGDGYIFLNWTEPENDGGSPLTEYRIYRGPDTDNMQIHASVPASETTYNDTGISNQGQTYYYYVVAVNSFGEGTQSNIVDVTMNDDAPPTVTITAPANNAILNSSTVTVRWQGNDVGSGINHYETSIDGGGWINVGAATSKAFGSVSDGTHSVVVDAYDNAGNSESDTVSFKVDTTKPIVSIISPMSEAILNNTAITVQWSGSDSGSGLSHYEVRLDSGQWIGKGKSTSHAFSGLNEGAHISYVRVFDMAGNGAVAFVFFRVDTSGPIVSIISPVGDDILNASSLEITWIGDDAGSSVEYYEVRIDSGIWVNVLALTNYEFTGLVDGYHIVEVMAHDALNNTGNASVAFMIDTVPPSVTAIQKDTEKLPESVKITWEATETGSGISHFEIRICLAQNVESISFSGDWTSRSLNNSYTFITTSDGVYAIQIRAVDRAGNVGTPSWIAFSVDSTSPYIVSHSPVGSNVSIDSMIQVSFSEPMNASSVGIQVTGLTGALTWDDNNDTVTFTPSGDLAFATEYTVHVNGSDSVGNPLPAYQWTFITTDMCSISGKILDENGNPVSGATVTIDGVTLTTTDSSGYYFGFVHGGNHLLKIQKEGYVEIERDLVLTPGETNNLGNLTITLASGGGSDLSLILALIAVIVVIAVVIVIVMLRKRK